MQNALTNLLNYYEPTVIVIHPRFEGSNICSWIGFKHVMYLAEEAVLSHLRQCDVIPRKLYEQFGICTEILQSEARILHALHMDDAVKIEVKLQPNNLDKKLVFSVQMFVQEDGKEIKAYTGKVKLLFRFDTSGIVPISSDRLPLEISPHISTDLESTAEIPLGNLTPDRSLSIHENIRRELIEKNANAFIWKWHVPYFYCHFNDRLQHSGYLRIMEEVVDLFLADRGISIRTMLNSQKWIPVVPNASIEIMREAVMEETIYTVYTVEEIFKEATYTSRMDCYVEREGSLIHTASGKITHGYAKIQNRRDWSLVNFDEKTINALKGK